MPKGWTSRLSTSNLQVSFWNNYFPKLERSLSPFLILKAPGRGEPTEIHTSPPALLTSQSQAWGSHFEAPTSYTTAPA